MQPLQLLTSYKSLHKLTSFRIIQENVLNIREDFTKKKYLKLLSFSKIIKKHFEMLLKVFGNVAI